MASYPNRNTLRGMGAIRVCVTIALISVTRVEAVVDNEMTDEQWDHGELMEQTELTNPEFGMKVFVYYEDKKNPKHLSPAVITGVNTMLDGSVEVNVRYLDGSTLKCRVRLENVFLRDDTVSYANWALDGYDPRTMDENGQPRVTSGSSSRPFVSRASTGAVFHGGASTGSSSRAAPGSSSRAAQGSSSRAAQGSSSRAAQGSSSRAAQGSSSGGGGAKASGAGKKRRITDAKTGKQPKTMTDAEIGNKSMEQKMEDALYADMDLPTAIAELKHDGVWMLEKTLELNKVQAQNAQLRAERNAAVERARQSNLRATAAEARVAVLQQQIESAEADSVRAERATRTRAPPSPGVFNHSACRDFQGTGSGK
jgi:hypothetical protein